MLKRLAKTAIAAAAHRRVKQSGSAFREFGDLQTISALAAEVVKVADERGFDDVKRFDLFYEIGRKLQPEFSINDRGRYFLKDGEFRRYFERFIGERGNWKNFERRWTVDQMLRLLPDVPGDLAECGVFEGAASYQLCRFAEKYGRTVHLFDSFQGISAPKENDGTHWTEGGLSASESTVHANLKEFACFKTYPGWIPERFAEVSDRRFAFVHIDVDVEQPTYDSIAFFYPRMNSGAIIILDDHGYDTCPGARKAALEYMADKREPVLDLATGQGMIIRSH